MIEKELLLLSLQERLNEETNADKRLLLQAIISDVLSNKFQVRIW